MKQIAFYVEGEEDRRDRRADVQLRRVFHTVFEELDARASAKGIKLQFRLYGSRRATYEKFAGEAALADGIYRVLLVDSEDPVRSDGAPGDCWKHLEERPEDQWRRPAGVEDDQCQLMVQAIEAWLLADPKALREFYGTGGFRPNALPKRANVEEIPKARHLEALEAATKDTQKGRYHKVKHLASLLFRLDMREVRRRAPHCERIFTTLAQRIESF